MTSIPELPSWENDLFAALRDEAETDPLILAAIQGLVLRVANRIYPGVAPTGVIKPYVTWQEVSTDGESELTSPSGVEHPLVQFVTWDADRNMARDVRKLIQKILEARTLPGDARVAATFSNKLFLFDEKSQLHGALLELRFHLDNQI